MTNKQRITEEDKQVIRRLYAQEGGKSLQDIGDALGGVSKQTVWYHVQKMGLEPAEDEEHEEQVAQANDLLSDDPDMTIKELSEHLDCSWENAKSIMEDLGYYEESVPFIDKVNTNRLIRLYVVEDMSLSDLNTVFPDVSEMTISKTLKDLGVPMRPQGGSTGKIRREWREAAIRQLDLADSDD